MHIDNLYQPLKQTLLAFKETQKHSPKQKNTHSMLQISNPETSAQFKKRHSALKPKLPSKKLFEEPRFFMSLQRKKDRILDGFKKMRQFSHQKQQHKKFQGRKIKQLGVSPSKRDTLDLYWSEVKIESDRRGWQPSLRTPLLNFNMHYLIRKRKSMTPLLQRQGSTMYQTLNSSRT